MSKTVDNATKTSLLPMPADGEKFTLTLNPIAPLEMVANDGYDPKNWRFHGTAITEPRTATFIFVAGLQPNLEAVITTCLEKTREMGGKIPEGQWREAINATFQPDGEHPRGIADPSWEDPDGDRYFPCLYEVRLLELQLGCPRSPWGLAVARGGAGQVTEQHFR